MPKKKAKKKKTAKRKAKVSKKKTATKKVAKKAPAKKAAPSSKETIRSKAHSMSERLRSKVMKKTPGSNSIATPAAKKIKKPRIFTVGEKAVYPSHGVGMIEKIENKEIAGDVMSFYVMRILDSELTVMIPMTSAGSCGLREIIPSSKVREVYKVFENRDIVIDTTTWNRRSREYTEKIKTGSVFEIAEVLRDIYVLKKTKTLSFGERRMMDTARTLLIKELAIAKSVSEDQIEKEIQEIFEQ